MGATKLVAALGLSAALVAASALPAPAFAQDVPAIGAQEIRAHVAENAGKVVVVNFWATWCPPCLREFPDIVRVFDAYHERGLEVLAVSLNAADEMEDVEAFLHEFEPPFPIALAATMDEAFFRGVVEPWYGEIPITLVYDSTGELVHYHRSAVTFDSLSADLEPLLPNP